jgi:TonB family protein
MPSGVHLYAVALSLLCVVIVLTTANAQKPKLTHAQVEQLVQIPGPDADDLLASQIRSRGLDFPLDRKAVEAFAAKGAGPHTLAVLRGMVPVRRVALSAALAQGLLLPGTAPVYPPIAKAARVSGTVVLQCTISESGLVEELQVVSGPPMLQQAALDAVKTWRYKPYLINKEPVKVETTVNVIYTLGR